MGRDAKRQGTYYLRQIAGSYFETGGFCFAILHAIRERTCRLDIYYQNRYERPCRARVIMQPPQQFLLNRRPVGSITLAIECEGGAFGVARIPWAVPGALQGKKQSFDIGADVEYPSGHGAMLRFRDGMQVGGAKREGWITITTLAGALGGIIVLSRPAKWTIRLPSGVDETVPKEAPILFATLWRPGDPPMPLSGTKAAGGGPGAQHHSASGGPLIRVYTPGTGTGGDSPHT
jgi:hypothetical protein